MRFPSLWPTLLLAAIACPLAHAEQARVAIIFETELGQFEVALDSALAPKTTANFLRYVDAGLFDGSTFYRTVRSDNQPVNPVKIAVIQGGLDERKEGFEAIAMESTRRTGLRHLDGTISMARLGPDTAKAEFFICVGPQPELDFGGRRNPDGFGFAAFGRVVSGMDVVRGIWQSAAEEQRLAPPILIHSARRRP